MNQFSLQAWHRLIKSFLRSALWLLWHLSFGIWSGHSLTQMKWKRTSVLAVHLDFEFVVYCCLIPDQGSFYALPVQANDAVLAATWLPNAVVLADVTAASLLAGNC